MHQISAYGLSIGHLALVEENIVGFKPNKKTLAKMNLAMMIWKDGKLVKGVKGKLGDGVFSATCLFSFE